MIFAHRACVPHHALRGIKSNLVLFLVYVLLKEALESGSFVLPPLTHTENLNHHHQSSLKEQKMKIGSINMISLTREFLSRKKNHLRFQKVLKLKSRLLSLPSSRWRAPLSEWDRLLNWIYQTTVFSSKSISKPQLSVSINTKIFYKELCPW